VELVRQARFSFRIGALIAIAMKIDSLRGLTKCDMPASAFAVFVDAEAGQTTTACGRQTNLAERIFVRKSLVDEWDVNVS
jgi:hypothetical protein